MPMASIGVAGRGKLGPKFFGPFQVTERIGDVAYRLKLPAGARIHDVFHVGLLKKFDGEPPKVTASLPPIRHGKVCLEPEQVIKCRLARGQRELLVRWKGQAASEATWTPLDEFQCIYPTFQLADELLVHEGEMSCGEFSIPGAGRARRQ
jgi:hypothetical protein